MVLGLENRGGASRPRFFAQFNSGPLTFHLACCEEKFDSPSLMSDLVRTAVLKSPSEELAAFKNLWTFRKIYGKFYGYAV